jgi:D-alanyl-D-alanine dipeptidase
MNPLICIDKKSPGIIFKQAYASTDNFTGEIIPGYSRGEFLLSEKAFESFNKALRLFVDRDLGVILFDAYRPVKAVEFFLSWSQRSEDRMDLKQRFYPELSREELFLKGYLAKRSSHSRGSTVDLGLWDQKTSRPLEMGSEFDFFHPSSHTMSAFISAEAKTNRKILCDVMMMAGFKNYAEEWWHFTLIDEPYPDRYFNHET